MDELNSTKLIRLPSALLDTRRESKDKCKLEEPRVLRSFQF